MKKGIIVGIALILILIGLPLAGYAQDPRPEGVEIEVEPELLAQLDADETAGYMIYLRERPDLSPALDMEWEERGWFVMNTLQAAAERSQAGVRAYLDAQGVEYQAFWIDNIIVVESSTRAIFDGLMNFPEIAALQAERMMYPIEPERGPAIDESILLIEPNISHVNADQVWGLGFQGDGMVVANIDTGVRFTHEVLERHYRGCLDPPTCSSLSHDYNWLDPDTGNTTPVDDHGHGSHTMGTMIGDDGGTNQVGMAPGARWIACDACNASSGCPGAALLTCAQWIAAPYPVGDPSSPDPDMRPNVVNNSWGDCQDFYDNWYQASVDNWHAAGIYPVFSNGNTGGACPPVAACNTVGNPARYGNVTGVGSTGRDDGQLAAHSLWGPTDNLDTVNPNGYPSIKPQVMAPGVNIRSSLNGSDSDYGNWGGTSMSAPHVSGLIALMWQACPDLIGDYATTETILETTAVAIPYASGCGGEGPGNVPNQATGWGEIDALAAVNEALNQCTPDFTIDATPDSLDVCMGDDAVYDVDIGQVNGFSNDVTLGSTGRPAGTTESFVPPTVTPPGNSTFTVGNTAAATPGSYSIDVIGTAAGPLVHQDTVVLNLYSGSPGVATLLTPADGSTGVSTTPNFTWNDVANEASYDIEIATDPGFVTIVDSASGLTSPTYTPAEALNADTAYYWRVQAINPCGSGSYSAIWAFRTINCMPVVPITHSTSQSIVSGNSVSCNAGGLHADNSYLRRFTLTDFSILGSLDVTSVDIGIESASGAGGSQPATMNLYTWDPLTAFQWANFSQIGTADTTVTDQSQTIINVPVAGSVPVGGTLVVEFFTPSGQAAGHSLFVGSNDEGQVDATYLAAAACGITEPTDTAAIGFPDMHLVMNVHGDECESSEDADYSDLQASYGIAWHTGSGTLRIGPNWSADLSFGLGDDDASDDMDTSNFDSFPAGGSTTLHVPVEGPAGNYWLRVWFDWDSDGVFDQEIPGEPVHNSGFNKPDGDPMVVDVTVNVPAGLSNPVYYRVRLYDSAGAPTGILAQDSDSYGSATGGEVEDGGSPGPLAVRLISFDASPLAEGILLAWETASEIDNLGFHLYRSTEQGVLGQRLNQDLIPSEAPGSGLGASYEFLDDTARPGVPYYYTLEDVDAGGARTPHGPVEMTLWRAYLPLVAQSAVER